jgi:hypothetical protein
VAVQRGGTLEILCARHLARRRTWRRFAATKELQRIDFVSRQRLAMRIVHGRNDSIADETLLGKRVLETKWIVGRRRAQDRSRRVTAVRRVGVFVLRDRYRDGVRIDENHVAGLQGEGAAFAEPTLGTVEEDAVGTRVFDVEHTVLKTDAGVTAGHLGMGQHPRIA